MRVRARVLAAVAAFAASAVPATQSHAVNPPAYTFVLPCTSGAVVSSGSLGVTLPSGVYAVTVTGVCSLAMANPHSIPVSTCIVTGPPCVNTGASVDLPGATCMVSVTAAVAGTCYPTAPVLTGCNSAGTVKVNGQCPDTTLGGRITHGGGPMTAQVIDGNYADNAGAYVVTAVLTVL